MGVTFVNHKDSPQWYRLFKFMPGHIWQEKILKWQTAQEKKIRKIKIRMVNVSESGGNVQTTSYWENSWQVREKVKELV